MAKKLKYKATNETKGYEHQVHFDSWIDHVEYEVLKTGVIITRHQDGIRQKRFNSKLRKADRRSCHTAICNAQVQRQKFPASVETIKSSLTEVMNT